MLFSPQIIARARGRFGSSGGGGGGFSSPLNLTGLIGWWDMSVSASITLSGSNITALADQSGAGMNLTNTGPGNVSYEATGFNSSYPTIHLNNITLSALGTTSFPMGTGNTLTAFYVGTCTEGATSAAGRSMSYSQVGVQDASFAVAWCVNNASSLTTNTFISRNSLTAGISSLSAPPAGHRFIYTIDSGGVMTAYVDGVASSTTTSAGNWTTGGNFALGRQAGLTNDYSELKISESGVATGFTDATTVALLDTYLKNKWGL